MSEAEFTRIVLSKIRPLLSDPWRIESRMSILYAISINEGGDVQLNVNDKGAQVLSKIFFFMRKSTGRHLFFQGLL
jgi:hypothetical protein